MASITGLPLQMASITVSTLQMASLTITTLKIGWDAQPVLPYKHYKQLGCMAHIMISL